MRARCFSGGRRDWVVGSGGGIRPLRRGGEGVVEICELIHDEVVEKERNRRRDRDRLRDIRLTLKSQRHTSRIFYFKKKILGKQTFYLKHPYPESETCCP